MKVLTGLRFTWPLIAVLSLPGASFAQTGSAGNNNAQTLSAPASSFSSSSAAFLLNPDMITVGQAAGFSTFALNSNCSSWAISWAPSWLTVSPSSGSNNATITLQYQANNSPNPRTAVLTVLGCGMSATFILTQNGTGPSCPVPTNLKANYIHYSVFTLAWDSMPGALQYQTRTRISGANTWLTGAWSGSNTANWFNMLPNALYECQVRDSCANGVGAWSGTYSLNTLGSNDPYCFSFGTSVNEWIQTVQFDTVNNNSGNNLGYRNYTNHVGSVQQGSTIALRVTPATNNGTHPVEWRVWIDLNKDNDFVDSGEMLVATTGNDQTQLNVAVPIATNAALGQTRMRIMMGTGNIPGPCNLGNGFWDVEDYTVNILPATQLNVSPDTILVNALAGNTNLSINGNCSAWTINGLPAWISANPISGSNSKTVVLTYQQNTSTSSRTTTFDVMGCGIIRKVTFIQAGAIPVLTVTPASFSLPAAGGWSLFNIQSNCPAWTITGAPSWLTLTNTSGANNGTIAMQLQPNPGTVPRSATLVVSGCGITRNVSVSQAGATPVLDVVPGVLDLTDTAGTTGITINSNCSDWTIVGAPSWMTLSATTGGGNANLYIQYTANTVPFARSAMLVLVGCGLSDTLVVTQQGPPLVFGVAPTGLNVGSDPGTFVFSVLSNCPDWDITGMPSWLQVMPDSGSGNATIVLLCEQNPVAMPRSATLTVAGCGTSQTFTLNQSAAPIALSVTPLALDFGAAGDVRTLDFSANCLWTLTYAPSWVTVTPPLGAGTALVAVEAMPNTDVSPRFDTLVFSVCNGLTESRIPIAQAGVAPPPAPWVVDTTGENHTIVVPDSVLGDFLGNPLEPGDRIGVFYDSLGVLRCAGYTEWMGVTTAFTVYGDDVALPGKNGLAHNELFKWRIWRNNANQVLEALATYAPIGTAGLVSHTERYANDGISMLQSITAVTSVLHTIPMSAGWNMISSHVYPHAPDMLQVFSGISDKVILVKDGEGTSAIPALQLNNIGDWDILAGYQVKTNEAIELLILGDKVSPNAHPIPLKSGWQIIAYLRDKPQDAADVFNGIAADIEIVKDNSGKNFIPAFGINDIGLMYPGRGYKVRALAPTVLQYTANLQGDPEEAARPRGGLLQHFVLDSINTGNNATLVVPLNVASGVLSVGDEIGIFTPGGTLCGAAIYAGKAMAVTVWGDDPTTGNTQEGMLPGEAYQVRVWQAASQLEYLASAAYNPTDGLYQPDDLEVLTVLELTSTGVSEGPGYCPFTIYPNPAHDVLYLQVQCAEDTDIRVELLRTDGRLQAAWTAHWPSGNQARPLEIGEGTPAGTYLLRVINKDAWTTKRVFIQR